ncbi:MAG TPA: thioredoxin family protein [Burkholderiaceae bacterium]|nr:thioredoxin family protein [Burkholderiaceae bacterium]
MDEIRTAAAGIADREQLAVCLCAAWCDTCDAYRVVFEAAAAQFRDARFVWLDIEDQEDLLGTIDVENFPTVLIAVGDQVRFFGTITPQPETLTRLLRASFSADAAVVAADEAVHALLRRLRGG